MTLMMMKFQLIESWTQEHTINMGTVSFTSGSDKLNYQGSTDVIKVQNMKTIKRIQYTRGKDMKAEKMWEVFQSARNGSEKYLICEGTPDDFYEREIMYLTATVLQQNLETKLPHLILFHDGTNDLEMKLLDELRLVS